VFLAPTCLPSNSNHFIDVGGGHSQWLTAAGKKHGLWLENKGSYGKI
jgi:hypothetical protein